MERLRVHLEGQLDLHHSQLLEHDNTASVLNPQHPTDVGSQRDNNSSSRLPSCQELPRNEQNHSPMVARTTDTGSRHYLPSESILEGFNESSKDIRHAAFLYRGIYVLLKELTYDRVLLGVREEGRELHITREGRNLFAYKGDHAVRRFPKHIFKNQDNAESMLLYRGCQDFLHFARPLFEKLIRPYCKSVRSAWIRPKNAKLYIVVQSDGDNNMDMPEDNLKFRHDIAILESYPGARIIFDPTGAQYGWGDIIAPYDLYKEHRVHLLMGISSSEITPYDEAQTNRSLWGGGHSHPNSPNGSCSLYNAVGLIRHIILSRAIKTLYTASGARGSPFLHELISHNDEEVFRKASLDILGQIKYTMEADAAFLESSFYLKVIPHGLHYEDYEVTTSLEMYERWGKIWLTQQQAAICQDRVQADFHYNRNLQKEYETRRAGGN
ncbi:hypothetical protein F5X99DRAFT_409590 [Biscogniauxia marginata]|nr:hypothetical protein F5X99DRAFT_409590 [Biscogniauxia marginata]